ncbi:MAG: FAD:protein FMN transferase [Ruminococcaceae bacterium]|nr:FAD:protein FMN transferase [Oscillospiraceae bacterium]
MSMRKYLVALTLAVALMLSALPSCAPRAEKFSVHSFDYFDTVTTVTGFASSKDDFDEIAEQILAELGEYHRLYTIYHRFEGLENLCTINELVDGQHRTVTVDRRIVDMLLYAKDMHEMTDGRVNIAMGSVLSIWHDYRTEGMNDPSAAKIPPMDRLTDAARHTDIHCLVIDEEACTVTLTDPGMTLDVGAIAKGYAVEMVARSLEEKGVSGYVLNVGGNVRTVGAKADGTPWIVGIENPLEDEENPYTAYLQLEGEALVTSGSYQRYYVVAEKRYHHIIDPNTLMPSEGFLSVSVVCKNSADGDALSTALFCMTAEEGLALVESLPDVEAIWVLPDGTRRTSSGWSRYESTQ